MLYQLVDEALAKKAITRVQLSEQLGYANAVDGLVKIDRFLREGTLNYHWLKQLAKCLNLSYECVLEANRYSLVLYYQTRHDKQILDFHPHVELTLDNPPKTKYWCKLGFQRLSEASPFKQLRKMQRCHEIAVAKAVYWEAFVRCRGQLNNVAIIGFRYHRQARQWLEFDRQARFMGIGFRQRCLL